MVKIKEINILKLIKNSYLLKSSGLLTFAQGISAVANFWVLSLFTKSLPPNEFGKISLLWMFVMIASILFDSGMNTAFSIRFYKEDKAGNTRNIYSIFTYYLIILIITYLICIIFPNLISSITSIKLVSFDINVLFSLLLFMLFGNFFTNLLLVDKNPQKYFFVKLLFNISLILTSLFFLKTLKFGFIAYFISYFISYFIISIWGFKFIIKGYKLFIKNIISEIQIKPLLHLGIPLVPNALLLMLLTWADRYIIESYSGLAIVGIYTVGYRFSEVIDRFIVNPFGKAFSPVIFHQFTNSIEKYKETLAKVFKYYWIIILGIINIYFVILKDVYELLIGSEYILGYNIIPIILLGIVFNGISNLISATIIMKEKTNKIFLFTSISVFFNIGLNFLLIPKYNMYGAAIATLISYIIQFFLIFGYTQKLLKIKYDLRYVYLSIFLSIIFLIIIILISGLNISTPLILLLKTLTCVLFITTVFFFMNFKNDLNSLLRLKSKN